MENKKAKKLTLFLVIMLVSNLILLFCSPTILEIRAVDILKIFSVGLLSGVLIILIRNWFRKGKEIA